MTPRKLLFSVLGAAGVGGVFLTLFRYGFPMTTILLLVIGLLVTAVGALAASAMRARRSGGGLEDGLKAQSEREAAQYAPDRKAEIERMQTSFDQAVEQLKASSLGGTGLFGKGKRALYALPWYLFVGPPGAGKTTALLESGLRFPAGAERVRGVGGTRNCDWFFTDEAILLDTAGRYTTEDEDREEWTTFLDLVRESRPDRPVNGVLVGISAQDLLGDERDLEDHADTIRRRVDELVTQLGLRLPVYLVVTKTDLVPGFVEIVRRARPRGPRAGLGRDRRAVLDGRPGRGRRARVRRAAGAAPPLAQRPPVAEPAARGAPAGLRLPQRVRRPARPARQVLGAGVRPDTARRRPPVPRVLLHERDPGGRPHRPRDRRARPAVRAEHAAAAAPAGDVQELLPQGRVHRRRLPRPARGQADEAGGRRDLAGHDADGARRAGRGRAGRHPARVRRCPEQRATCAACSTAPRRPPRPRSAPTAPATPTSTGWRKCARRSSG